MGAGEIKAGEAFVEIGGRDAPLARALKRSQGRLNTFGSRVARLGASFVKFGSIAASVIGGIGFVKAIRAASAFQETLSKFEAVFKEQSAATLKWAKAFSRQVGRAQSDVVGFLATMQDTFVPLGFARDRAAELSKQLTKLAVDLASFNNESEAETIRSLQSALVGNTETVRKYGVIITQATLSTELLNLGLAKNVQEATEQEKVLARLSIIMKSTTDAQGDAIRTADGFANRMRALTSALSDLAVTVGDAFLPELARLAGSVTENIRGFAAWLKEGNRLRVSFINLQITFVEVMAGISKAIIIARGVFDKFGRSTFNTLFSIIKNTNVLRVLWINLQITWERVSTGIKVAIESVLGVFQKLGSGTVNEIISIIRHTSIVKALWLSLQIVWTQLGGVIATTLFKIKRAIDQVLGRDVEAAAGAETIKRIRQEVQVEVDKLKKELEELVEPAVFSTPTGAARDSMERIEKILEESAFRLASLKEDLAEAVEPALAAVAEPGKSVQDQLKELDEQTKLSIKRLQELKKAAIEASKAPPDEARKKADRAMVEDAAKQLSGVVGGFGAFASRLLAQQLPTSFQDVARKQLDVQKEIAANTKPGEAARRLSDLLNRRVGGDVAPVGSPRAFVENIFGRPKDAGDSLARRESSITGGLSTTGLAGEQLAEAKKMNMLLVQLLSATRDDQVERF